MLRFDDWPDWRDTGRVPDVPGDANAESMESDGWEGSAGSWKVVQLFKTGDVEVKDALKVEIRKCGAKTVALGGRDKRD